jgi:tetratricopeptide (TPR) repeat protein
MGRLEDAQRAIEDAFGRKLEHVLLHADLYVIAFLNGDANGMAAQQAWARGSPEEQAILALQADTEAYHGHLAQARQLTRQAVELSAASSDQVANWWAMSAEREALLGNLTAAKNMAASSLRSGGSSSVRSLAVLAIAQTGDAARAEQLEKALAKTFPSDTLVNAFWLPSISSTIALVRNKPLDAIGVLESVHRYELAPGGCLLPIYLRGLALLQAGKPLAATTEFEKFETYRGAATNCATVPLARLGLAHAYHAAGDFSKARATYKSFIDDWKTADPDIPILRRAKSEYRQLQLVP